MNFINKKKLENFQSSLHLRRKELEVQLTSSADGAKPVDLDTPIGRLSRMDAMQQQQMAQASRRIAEQRLLQIDAALQRIATEDYGLCVECDEEIGLARLAARPETPFCVVCQSRREKG